MHTANNASSAPMHYGVIIFNGFQALDLFGSMDFLNMLSAEVPMKLSILADTLDPVSTQVANNVYNIASTQFSQSLVPTHTFANPPKDLDVIFVPGGYGASLPQPQAVTFIKASYPSLKNIISVCNGATLLAAAGVLDGRRATTSKAIFAMIADPHPNVKWQPRARWVQDGNVWTSSGVSAGMDLIYEYIKQLHGEEVASRIARMLEYEPHKDPENDPFAAVWKVPGTEKASAQNSGNCPC